MDKPLGVDFLRACVKKAHAIQEADLKKRKVPEEKESIVAQDGSASCDTVNAAVVVGKAFIEREIELRSAAGYTRAIFTFFHKEEQNFSRRRLIYLGALRGGLKELMGRRTEENDGPYCDFPKDLEKPVCDALVEWCKKSKLHIMDRSGDGTFEVSWGHHEDEEEIEVKG